MSSALEKMGCLCPVFSPPAMPWFIGTLYLFILDLISLISTHGNVEAFLTLKITLHS